MGAYQITVVPTGTPNSQRPTPKLGLLRVVGSWAWNWEWLDVGSGELGVYEMLVIRMRRVGTTKKPYFRVVVTEAKTARESSFVENVGTYNPRSKPAQVEINKERLEHWLKRGAQPSDSVRTLIKKHLTRDLSAPAATPPAQ